MQLPCIPLFNTLKAFNACVQQHPTHSEGLQRAAWPCSACRRALWVQEKFKHFKDLWRLHVATWAWEQLPGKGGPNGRSGHRMALHGNQLLIFGGFNDSGKSTTCGLPCVYAQPVCDPPTCWG